MLYNGALGVGDNELHKLNMKTAGLNETDIDMYVWVVDGPGLSGKAMRGGACKRQKKSAMATMDRYNAIVETAAVRFVAL